MYSCLTELFEIEPFICIKMDLALNNLQILICHKTLPTNQPTNQRYIGYIFICMEETVSLNPYAQE